MYAELTEQEYEQIEDLVNEFNFQIVRQNDTRTAVDELLEKIGKIYDAANARRVLNEVRNATSY